MNPLPKWLTGLGGYIAVACAAIGAWYANNVFQQNKGKAEVIAENNEQELEAVKRMNKRENETEDTNRALPRRKLFSKLRKQASKNGN